MKQGKYAQTLAKIQVRGIIVYIWDIQRNVLPKFIDICMYGDGMLVPVWMGTNMAGRNQQKNCLPSFVSKAWICFSRNS